MKTLTLKRTDSGFGGIVVDGKEYHTLENTELQIPAGVYQSNWEPSPRLNRETYRLVAVPGRSGILIHPANFAEELLGCIALGWQRGELDGKPALLHSRAATTEFEDQMGRDSFMLAIEDA